MPPLPSPNSKTRKDRVEYVRNHINHDGVRQYIALFDNAKDNREIYAIEKRELELIPDYKDLSDEVRDCLYDARWENEDRIGRERKQADKDRIAAKKASKINAAEEDSKVLQRYMNYPMLREAITTVSESFRPELINSFRDDKLKRLGRFITYDLPQNRLEVQEPVWEGRSEYSSVNDNKRRVYKMNQQFIQPYHDSNILKPNYKEMVQTEAEQYAEYVLEEFRGKLAWKLGPVIDRKGGGTVDPHGDVDRHTIRINFPDNSGFTIKSQIVHSVSKNGVFFSRHPLTFHNVTFEDGTRMKTPSAARMQKEFGIDIKDNDKKQGLEV